MSARLGASWPRICITAARHAARVGFIVAVAWAAGLNAQASSPNEFRIAAPPDWVERQVPDTRQPAPAQQISQGVYHRLIDQQTRVQAQDKSQYRHIATQALNEAGVEAVAHVEVSFDPSYQQLTLHAINVLRGGRVIPKLQASAVRMLQRETELDYRIYDGSQTANVFIDDVRVGDIVEYAYTLRGANPVFANQHFGQVDLQWSVPVQRITSRLLWPQQRAIYFAKHQTEVEPQVREHPAYREYRWDTQNVPALAVESDAPGWFDPYPKVQWAEFQDWGAVARWALPLYDWSVRPSPALQAEVDRIAAAHADPAQRLIAVLQFVQREIRYLGVEAGAGSHAPSSPQVVLQRRFGDCKDKALLMVTMLHALGIEARPALVNTELRRGIVKQLASPGVFNHVLVHARLAEQGYWLDPTRAPQTGSLATVVQPDYGHALLIDSATTDLLPMHTVQPRVNQRQVRVVFDAQSGLDQPVHLTVTTTLDGAAAEDLRRRLAADTLEALQKRYVNFYVRYYPGLTASAPMQVDDDPKHNRLTTTEHYSIPTFWQRSEVNRRLEAAIYVPDVEEFLRRPSQTVRTAPLGLPYPIELQQTTDVLLPQRWNIAPEQQQVSDPAFEFERRTTVNQKTITFQDRFVARADHIAAADTARYVANLDRARSALNYVLFMPEAGPQAASRLVDRFNWLVALVGILLLLIFGWVSIRLYHYDPPAAPSAGEARLQGISGWLLLPAIGVLLAPLRIGSALLNNLSLYAVDTWSALTTWGSAQYHAMWAPVLLFELASNVALVVFGLLLAVLFYQRRSSLPKVYIGFMSTMLALMVIDLALLQCLPEAAQAAGRQGATTLAHSLVWAVIWGRYFMVSQRVKATFVRGLQRASS